MDGKKVLITGGAGYLGSVLIGHLLEKGYEVTCLDNLSYGQKSIFIYSFFKNFHFKYGDVRDRQLLEKLVPEFDIIIPLAAIVGMPACDKRPVDAKTINYDSVVLINEIRRPDQKLIYPTTNSGYGAKTGEVFCTEETPLEPISLYGRTKSDAESHLLNSGKDVITLRLATVFGTSPRMRTDLLVNDFVLKAMREGYLVVYQKDFKRNYIHIRDVARCFEHCINNFDLMKNNIYNVGLEEANLSKKELVELIRQALPKFEIIYKEFGEDPDKRNYVVSNKKILNTGFKPIFSIKEGIKELIKGYEILLKNDPYTNL
jgi:nucleoside-diphosphate-sugar epimerase